MSCCYGGKEISFFSLLLYGRFCWVKIMAILVKGVLCWAELDITALQDKVG